MTTRARRLLHPLILIAVIALALFTARLAGAQQTGAARQVAVATRPLPRGTVLTLDDFEVRDTTLRSWNDTTKVAAGWVTRSAISRGEILRAPAVEPPVVVSANSPVQVEYADGGVRLTMRGIAARNGSIGERVPVRIDTGSSMRRVEGTVIAPGRIRID
jgi:flagella basal body P-ring formation protein FlgA